MQSLVFDALFLSVPILLAMLGLGRGGQREAVTLIGILAGALLGALWREPWGARLAVSLNRDPALMQAVVFDVLLLATATLLGYGSAVLLPPRRQAKTAPMPALGQLPGYGQSRGAGRARLAGGLLGGLNGLLLVGLLLWSAAQAGSAGVGGAVESSRLGQLVSQRLPLVLLIVAIAIAGLNVATLIGRILRTLKRAQAPGTFPYPTQQQRRPREGGQQGAWGGQQGGWGGQQGAWGSGQQGAWGSGQASSQAGRTSSGPRVDKERSDRFGQSFDEAMRLSELQERQRRPPEDR